MNDIDYILDFAVHLGAHMLASGANLERVDDTIYRVCLSYRLEEISLFSLSSIIQLGARTADGTYGYRQLSIPATGIHLERLNNLNRIVVNTLCMLFAGTAAQLLVWLGLGSQYFIIIITCGLMMVPGIPLVNSVRNLLCGNEMNGILEFLKAVLETPAIVAGLILSIFLFGDV